jgi:tRNA A-37 threonylcarbamoyl transferase component Bud32
VTSDERRIGRYQLEHVIGTGAFAAVYRAVDERLGDTVAVKLLADNHCLDPDVRQRFIAEGRALRRVDSPHVIRVHDIGETGQQQPFLVLEHADRGTLAQRVADLRATGWTPGPDDIRVVARSLGAAVEALHRADIVHRDLSPGNVLLRSTMAPRADPETPVVAPDERLVLADLGLCKDLAGHSGLTAAGGTEGFRPPEQRGGPTRVDGRADLWALSALLVWMATDAPPGNRPVIAGLTAVGLPKRLGQTLSRSLDDDPTKRHPDVAAWLDEVEAALTPAGDPSAEATRGHPAVGRSSRRRVAAGLVVGVGLGAAVVWAGGALLDRGSDEGTMTRIDDDLVQVASESGSARVALVGPEETPVGEMATFVADANRDVTSWVWLMPDGRLVPDASQVELRTNSAGVARVTLLAVASSGERFEATHDLRVVEE